MSSITKKFKKLNILLFVVSLAFTSYCNQGVNQDKKDNSTNALLFVLSETKSESNFDEDSANSNDLGVGPEGVFVDSQVLKSNELLDNIIPSIQNGQTNVSVNEPISIRIFGGLDSTNTTSQNSYIANEQGQVLYTRVLVQGDKITLIPQIRLQPTKTYYAVFGGIQNQNGNDLGSVVIQYTNTDVDYGLYWYGKYGLCEKYVPGLENAFYENSKKTVVYAHGWQPDTISQEDPYGRSGFNYEIFYWSEDNFGGKKEHNGLRKLTNHAWIDKGWNTGIVYWNQFADEPSVNSGNLTGVHAAEAKIWNFDGPNGSRYRTQNANGDSIYKDWNRNLSFKGQSIQVSSIGEVLSLYAVDALKDNYSGNIRLVGHSLGNQVATYLAKEIDEANIRINRVALLDPAWTQGEKDYLPVITSSDENVVLNHNGAHALSDGSASRHFWNAEMTRIILFRIMNKNWSYGFGLEIYHTTALNLTIPVVDNNEPLTDVAADISNSPWFYSNTQISQKHIMIRHHYFWSMESAAPIECTISWWQRHSTGRMAGDASTPDWRIQEMMQENYKWTQVEGRYTPDPSDDWFERKSK